MHTTLNKTALAAAVAATIATTAVAPADANVINMSWKGAFTFLNPSGSPLPNAPSDYANGFYGVTGTVSGPATTYGWKGNRTPITGTMSFDTSTGAGVATVNSFLFFGNGNANYANSLSFTFQSIDTEGTLVASLLYSWNSGTIALSAVLDASGLLNALPAAPGTTIAGVGSLPGTDGLDFDNSPSTSLFLPLGPSPVATMTLNTARKTPAVYDCTLGPDGHYICTVVTPSIPSCDGLTLATQVNAYTINTNSANLAICTNAAQGFGVDDGISGDPLTGTAFSAFHMNFDILSLQVDSYAASPVPVPPALWLFGSGLLGLIGLARRRKPIKK